MQHKNTRFNIFLISLKTYHRREYGLLGLNSGVQGPSANEKTSFFILLTFKHWRPSYWIPVLFKPNFFWKTLNAGSFISLEAQDVVFFYFKDSSMYPSYTCLNVLCKTCNHDHNILRLFDVWPNFPFTTVKAKRDYK